MDFNLKLCLDKIRIKYYILITGFKSYIVMCRYRSLFIRYIGFHYWLHWYLKHPLIWVHRRKNIKLTCCQIVLQLESIFPGIHFWEVDVQFSNADNFLVTSIYWAMVHTDFVLNWHKSPKQQLRTISLNRNIW